MEQDLGDWEFSPFLQKVATLARTSPGKCF